MTLKVKPSTSIILLNIMSNQEEQWKVRQIASSNITACLFAQVHNKNPKNFHETSELPLNTIFQEKAFCWKIPD